jgi:excisionase family DNA binding protein
MAQVAKIRDFDDPIVPSSAESEEAGRVYDFMARQAVTNTPGLVSETGEVMPLPVTVYRVLQKVAEEMSRGNAVAVLPVHHELTTTQAADMLNVSRPYLVGLLDGEQIPSHKVGSHRRVRLDDLLAYKHRRDGSRRETLKRLSQEAQDMGLDF